MVFQQNILQQALDHHRAGRLQQAEALYRQVLAAEPDHPEALLFLGMLYHQVGKIEIAVELIGKVINCKPDYVDAHYNLGNALMDLGRLDEAAASFNHALKLKPDFADAYNNLGVILKEQGKLDEAAASFRRTLKLKPDSAMAHYNLGNVLMDQGRFDEAVAGFRQALTLEPNYIAVHYNLGKVLMVQEKMHEAAASFRNAVDLKPDFAEAHNHLGVIYSELGKMDDAIASFKKALSCKSDYTEAFMNLSLIVKYTEVDDNIKEMEDLYYKRGDIPDTDCIALGFALGKVYEDLRNYEKSFDFILEANNLKRKSYEYSIQNAFNLFARIKRIFSPDFFASHHCSGHQDRTPVFIVGMPRSGTTLVEQILASHPQVFGAGELVVLENLINSICTGDATAQFPECMLDFGGDEFESMGSQYLEKLREYSSAAEFITNKMPSNFLYVGLIRTILPHAKVIHTARNPMDNCYSIYKKNFTGKGSVKYAYDMAELGQYYNLYRALMAHWEKVLPGFMYTVRYEEVVSDQQNQTKNLLDFCGLPWDDACLAFYKTERTVGTASLAQVRQPIYKDSVELWKRYEKQLEPLRKAIYG